MEDVPGFAAYFWAYEWLKELFGLANSAEENVQSNSNSSLNLITRIWCGGVAGQISWIVSYPFDIIKTEIQCTQHRKVSMREVCIKGYRAYGFYYFWKGLYPTLIKSFIANGVTLPLWDLMTRYYQSQK